MDERRILMNRIQVCSFVLDEVRLFLDTHPNSQEALEYFGKYTQLEKEAEAEYISKFGPIRTSDFDNWKTWKWIDNPWPWENTMEV